jgi:hypothetical protein
MKNACRWATIYQKRHDYKRFPYFFSIFERLEMTPLERFGVSSLFRYRHGPSGECIHHDGDLVLIRLGIRYQFCAERWGDWITCRHRVFE